MRAGEFNVTILHELDVIKSLKDSVSHWVIRSGPLLTDFSNIAHFSDE